MKLKSLILGAMAAMLCAGVATAQENYYVPTTVGMKLEYVALDKKEAPQNYMVMTVESVTETPQGTAVVLNTQVQDKNHKDIDGGLVKQQYLITKSDVSIDLAEFIKASIPEQPGLETEVIADPMIFPMAPAVGQELTPWTVSIILTYQGQEMIQSQMSDGRTVQALDESVTTDAGTYPCLKILEVTSTTDPTGAATKAREEKFYTKGIGEVMTRTVNSRGIVQGSQKLLSVTMPE